MHRSRRAAARACIRAHRSSGGLRPRRSGQPCGPMAQPAAAQGIVPPHSAPLSRLSAAWLSARQTQAAQANADADAPVDGMLSVSRADGGQLPSLVAAAAADGKPDDGADAKAEVRAALRGSCRVGPLSHRAG